MVPSSGIDGGGGIPPAAPNTVATFTIQRGEHIQLSQSTELTGSPIQSTKPIAVFGGADCLTVPPGPGSCDTAHQQIPPIKALGHEYVGVRYRDRGGNESTPWRLVGAVDGTSLSWVPSPPPGAPMTLNFGEVADFQSPGGFVVKSQGDTHPFYVAQYMSTGASFDGVGDPEFVNVIAPAQYLDHYILFTDPNYSETNFVVVRKRSKATGMFADVTLECTGVLGGWQSLGDYEFTRVDLVTGNFQNVGNCSNGRQEMRSDAPFGVTVWGWGGPAASVVTTYVSYAYPAGASIRSINEVVVPVVPK